jgi:hypothetical protein
MRSIFSARPYKFKGSEIGSERSELAATFERAFYPSELKKTLLLQL